MTLKSIAKYVGAAVGLSAGLSMIVAAGWLGLNTFPPDEERVSRITYHIQGTQIQHTMYARSYRNADGLNLTEEFYDAGDDGALDGYAQMFTEHFLTYQRERIREDTNLLNAMVNDEPQDLRNPLRAVLTEKPQALVRFVVPYKTQGGTVYIDEFGRSTSNAKDLQQRFEDAKRLYRKTDTIGKHGIWHWSYDTTYLVNKDGSARFDGRSFPFYFLSVSEQK
ncbi:hypothetical protein HZB02_06865 [Candidatus Woesearchaeota archaeon]|nr:hypothetical protein [Candidatus Woesearchaeota archaeon]